MFLHPVVAIFMALWLGVVLQGALFHQSGLSFLPWGMFVFGIVLVAVGFIPEVITAKRLITLALSRQSAGLAPAQPVSRQLA